MHIMRRRGWELPEHEATPEHLFFDRRAFLMATGAASVALSPAAAMAQRLTDLPDPTQDLYPAKHQNEKYKLDRPVTDESITPPTIIFTSSVPRNRSCAPRSR